MNQSFKKFLLARTGSSDCFKTEVIQSLWSGYGEIARYQLIDSNIDSVVIKKIDLTNSQSHPRGWNTDLGHQRKVKSYKVETEWYVNYSQFCEDSCRIPTYLGDFTEGLQQWIILEDLNPRFPKCKTRLNLDEVKICLKWLAHFHAKFINKKPEFLWEVGTYWHLDTRPEEFEKIEQLEIKSKAHLINEKLNNCQFKTLVHGDAKPANFCFSEDVKEVAAVDFQYVGGGCGMKDVAYFLGSCLSGEECEIYEPELLSFYFTELESALINYSVDLNFDYLKTEWFNMYPYACADFSRFLLGWMPTHQKMNAYSNEKLKQVLDQLTLI